MPDPPELSPAPDPDSRPRAPRHISPWMLVTGAVVLTCLVLVGFLAVLVGLQGGNAARPRGIQERRMPDGTVLVLEQITFGRSHKFELRKEEPIGGWLSRGSASRHVVKASTADEAIMLWLTRHDASSGAPLDFDWWSHCIAVEEHGCNIEDREPCRHALYRGHSSRSRGARPFRTAGAPNECIVVRSDFPKFRHSGETFKLRVYDVAGTIVAEFDAPNPARGPYPTWTPDPLPVTKTDGDLSVTLADLKWGSVARSGGNRKIERRYLQPTLQFTQNGISTAEWNNQIQIFDALGNTTDPFGTCDLCRHETAWKLHARLIRHDQAQFEPDELWRITAVPLPAAGASVKRNEVRNLQDVTLEFLAVGGYGEVAYTRAAAPGSGSGSRRSGGNEYKIESRTDQGRSVTTVDGKMPHIAFRATGLSADHQLSVRVKDNQGRTVGCHRGSGVDDVQYWFLKLPPDAKTVDFTFIVQKARTVEFLVKPPELPATPRGEAAQRP